MDTQFLVSLRGWMVVAGQFLPGAGTAGFSLVETALHARAGEIVLYPLYIACGVAIYYSLMIALAATSVWLGRNLTLLDFWFY